MQEKVGSVKNDISIKKADILGCKVYDADTVFEMSLKRKKKTNQQQEIEQDSEIKRG